MMMGAAGLRAGLDRHFLRRTVEVAGCFVPLLAFAAVHRQLDDVSVAAVEGLIKVNQCLNTIMARGEETQALERVTRSRGIDDHLLIGPKAVHIDAEDLLRLWAVADLEARLVLGIRGKHDEQPAVERSLAEIAARI